MAVGSPLVSLCCLKIWTYSSNTNPRQHVNEDHEPYVCISEKCAESLPRFATSTQWFQHMLTTHGQNWHREVQAPSSWACPLCTEEGAIFSKPSDLTLHLEDSHEGTFTEPQIQAIMRQSQFRFPRPRGICPLCCLPISDQHDPPSKEAGKGNGESSSREPHYMESSEGSHNRSKMETSHTPSDQSSGDRLETIREQRDPRNIVDPCLSNPVSVEVIASHIAAHLQGVMILTLRLISIDVAMDVSADDQSASGTTDHQSSWVGSSKRGPDQKLDSIEDFSLQGGGEIDLENSPSLEDIVPDSEYNNWHGVPRYYETHLEDNLPLKAVMSNPYKKYKDVCDGICQQIYNIMERRYEDKLCFVSKGTTKKILHRYNLMRFFRSMLFPGHTPMEQFHTTEEDFIRRIDERGLHNFLAILIFANCDIDASRAFITKLVAKDAWPVLGRSGRTISSLPADRENLLELFGAKVSTDQFFTKQACFLPVMIRRREEVWVQDPEKQRLPYLEEQLLKAGPFWRIHKVRIARGHLYDAQTKAANFKAVEVARKDDIINYMFPAQDHHQLMEILAICDLRCENIIQNYGSLKLGSKYSLFMPLAVCDLQTYMMKSISGPSSTMEKADIISSTMGLARGLDFLHNGMKTSNITCYHMNVSPRSILLFQETQNKKTRYIWRLGGFHLARVVIRHLGKNGETGEGSNWSDDGEPVLNRRGEGSYLGPESLSLTPSMTAKSDVWSLGCIISILFTYLEGGGEGVTQYRKARLAHRASDGSDRFFVPGSLFTPTKVHPVVKSWHTNLIDKAHERDPREGDAVEFMLRYLEKNVFEITPAKRDNARKVEERLLETFRKYSTLAEGPAGTQAR